MSNSSSGPSALTEQVMIVTGANTGIGMMTAVGLARAGANVVMACRDLARSEPALAEVRSRGGGSSRVHLMRLDLASLASVRAFVDDFSRRFDRLDVLVSNAGIAPVTRQTSADGFELQLAVHHLGPFLLTTSLLPLLESSTPSRVVVVAGSAQRSGRINWDDLQCERKYSMTRAGGQSRLANLLFVRELAARTRLVTANALDPGATATGISRDLPAPVRALSRLMKSPEQGARTSVYLATSPEVAQVTGGFFKGTRQVAPNPRALDDDAARRLWEMSEQMVGTSAS